MALEIESTLFQPVIPDCHLAHTVLTILTQPFYPFHSSVPYWQSMVRGNHVSVFSATKLRSPDFLP